MGTKGFAHGKETDSPTTLRADALASSEEASRLLQEAFDLLIQGRRREAVAKQEAAREKQDEARVLMERATEAGRP